MKGLAKRGFLAGWAIGRRYTHSYLSQESKLPEDGGGSQDDPSQPFAGTFLE